MPELPEVETVRRGLNNLSKGLVISEINVLEKKSCKFSVAKNSNAAKYVLGSHLVNFRRFGKLLVIDLSSDYSLLIHLRMTGQLVFYCDKTNAADFRWGGGHPSDSFINELPDTSTRVIFKLDNPDHIGPRPGTLFFNDQRKFGFIDLVQTKDVENCEFVHGLGPEPVDAKGILATGDPITPENASEHIAQFIERIRHHPRLTIKGAILDQHIVAGVGNIYADESLFASRVHPAQLVKELSDEYLSLIFRNAAEVMQLSIKHGGSTMQNYVDASGKKGAYLDFAQVFRREGKPCYVCGTLIEKIRVSTRGTHFCPTCQVLH